MHKSTSGTRSVINKTLNKLAWKWKKLSLRGGNKTLVLRPDLPDDDLKELHKQLQECLEARGGEVSARAHAAVIGQAYLNLTNTGRYRFLRLIAEKFGVPDHELRASMTAYLENSEQDPALLEQIKKQLMAPWVKLFTQFNALPSGVNFLIDMRTDLIRFGREYEGLDALDIDLKQLLMSWFNIGFLDLKRITWNEPASLLEKLIAYEAVYEIQSWDDLKNRLDSDRCCYAFFHPRMPDEPLIFVLVALVNGISENIHELLDSSAPVEDPYTVDTAVFYSISNTQLGLRGISMGNFLIKRVVDDLARHFPNLKTYITLSPIPGFRVYLENYLKSDNPLLLNSSELEALQSLVNIRVSDREHEFLETNKIIQPLLSRLCIHYLINEKRGIGAIDSVANFHLNNGAGIEQINWLGDHSEQGIKRSMGVMVNYRYKLEDIEKNHEAYNVRGKIKYSSKVKSLLKPTT